MPGLTRRALLCGLAFSGLLLGADRKARAYGTRAAVVEMVTAAAEAVATYGFPDALRNSPQSDWRRPDLDLYVFVMDTEGTLLLHPSKRAEGQNVSGSRDRNGTYFIREIIKGSALTPDGCWTQYMWPDPTTGNMIPKRTYARRAGGVIICAGYAGADV